MGPPLSYAAMAACAAALAPRPPEEAPRPSEEVPPAVAGGLAGGVGLAGDVCLAGDVGGGAPALEAASTRQRVLCNACRRAAKLPGESGERGEVRDSALDVRGSRRGTSSGERG